ncbi:MAG: NigD-like N-terminal domain-containing protein [Alistipes sp.]|nr:NigD-like N-terminal domain-containing protein [Alistipes sp.]
MKLTKWFSIFGVVAVAALALACNDNDEDWSKYYPNALVTVVPTEDEGCFLQLDDNTTLKPVNMAKSPFGNKEVRALTNYSPSKEPAAPYDRAVYINWIDSILTKDAISIEQMVPDFNYGEDPVEIVRDWVTIAEDGYLTLRFRTIWGNIGRAHYVNLITGVNPGNPYEVEFRHNANGDTYGFVRDGIVAFRLDGLPDTEGKTVKLTLKWNSFSGTKTAHFNYRTRTATPAESSSISDERPVVKIQ